MFSKYLNSGLNRLSRHPLVTALAGATFLIGTFLYFRNDKEDISGKSAFLKNTLGFVDDFSVTNNHDSVVFFPPKNSNTFRGSAEKFMALKNHNGIKRIEICGIRLSNHAYDASGSLDLIQLERFLSLIDKKKIKELSFIGCKLDAKSAGVIGTALKTNNSLERLEITTNEVGHAGLLILLQELRYNKTLKILYARSYNVQCYFWSREELSALAELAVKHPTLQKIELPNNQLEDFSDLQILLKEYTQSNPTIIGLEVSRSYSIPPICQENMENLEEISTMQFQSRKY